MVVAVWRRSAGLASLLTCFGERLCDERCRAGQVAPGSTHPLATAMLIATGSGYTVKKRSTLETGRICKISFGVFGVNFQDYSELMLHCVPIIFEIGHKKELNL